MAYEPHFTISPLCPLVEAGLVEKVGTKKSGRYTLKLR
jgi:hypothetical protein